MTKHDTQNAVSCDLAPKLLGADDRGESFGYDPRQIGRSTLEALTAGSKSLRKPIKAIRAKCLDCCCGSAPEGARCHLIDCPLWPMRMGVNPFHGQAGKPRPGAVKNLPHYRNDERNDDRNVKRNVNREAERDD